MQRPKIPDKVLIHSLPLLRSSSALQSKQTKVKLAQRLLVRNVSFDDVENCLTCLNVAFFCIDQRFSANIGHEEQGFLEGVLQQGKPAHDCVCILSRRAATHNDKNVVRLCRCISIV